MYFNCLSCLGAAIAKVVKNPSSSEAKAPLLHSVITVTTDVPTDVKIHDIGSHVIDLPSLIYDAPNLNT